MYVCVCVFVYETKFHLSKVDLESRSHTVCTQPNLSPNLSCQYCHSLSYYCLKSFYFIPKPICFIFFSKRAFSAGEQYGQLDSSTKSGYNVEFVSEEIIRSVAESRRELVLAPVYVRLAILLRSLAPGLYRYVMARRAAKERKQQ